MNHTLRAFFKRISNFFSPPQDPDVVTIQNVHGNLEDVSCQLLFRPMWQLIENGTPERAELLEVLTGIFGNNSNMPIGKVIQSSVFDLENQGMTIGQIEMLQEILKKEGLALGIEIHRPTWQELMDEVTAIKSDKWDYWKSLK
jgi:hypothetical protein